MNKLTKKHNYLLLILYIILISAVIVSFNSCFRKTSNNNYISFLITSEESDGSLQTKTYQYSIKDDRASLKSTLPYYAQYPLSVYNKFDNSIYYSYRDDTHSDQLYRYDLKSKKTSKLTTNLFAINYIIPVDDTIYLGAVFKTRREITLLKYQDGTLTQLLEDDDLFVQKMHFNPDTMTIAFNTYSNKEADKRFEEYDSDPNRPLTGINTIWTLDVSKKDTTPMKKQSVGEGDMHYIMTDDKNNIYYYQEGKHYILNDEIRENTLFTTLDINTPIEDAVYIKNNELYFISANKLLKYNLKTNKETVIYKAPSEKSIMNSASICK